MNLDLESMSREDLLALRKDVERAIETVDDRRRAEARAAAEKAARDHGYSLEDVVGSAKKAPSGKKNPPKYRNPEDARQTWSGRGRKPGWIKDALASGRSLDDFAI
ncbi:H-NS histone family protein [Palleronia abyssalis]|uniref:Trans-acting regulatory protein HvrA n=1 Tax=Palleronia abyssalis TaxID=1501240 RepID=A0A2R8C1H3_9RHOB|nr:H-NS histone family protein [Palleronia abyssalis]SPJ26264.1 Trans-acting regulatory protein HvrA [Palleronia abyssalis]